MTRACRDCGIADWQPCVCMDDRADRERDDHATLVAIHHAVDTEAYRQLTSVDPALQPVSEPQRVMALAARLGAVADCVRENGCLDIEAAVVALCAEGQNWVEALAREGAR